MRTYKPAGIAALEKYGYRDIEPRYTYEVWGRNLATMKPLLRKRPTLRWFKATTPGGETVLLLRQAQNCWHVFGIGGWTGSGGDPKQAYCGGGLGDVIGTDAQMSAYKRWVRQAPMTWAGEFAGLWEAKQQVR